MRIIGNIMPGSLITPEARKKMMGLVVLLEGLGFPYEGEDIPEDDDNGPTDKQLFKQGFQHYLKDVGITLGIKDLKRTLGVGIKNLARMMCLDEVPNMDPPLTYREVIYRIFKMLLDRPDGLKHDLVTDLLRMTRAIVYMDDPLDTPETIQASQDAAWDDYVIDLPPKKQEPQREVIAWVQTKVASLGGIVAAGQHVFHPSPTVSIAALRLGITLMESGNETAQSCLLKNLVETQNDDFFWAFAEYLSKACIVIKEWRIHLKKKALAEELRTRRGSSKNGVAGSTSSTPSKEPADEEEQSANQVLKETSLALRFLQLLMEGHYLPFQNLLREQVSNRVSHNILNSATELLIVIESSLQFCFDNKYGTLLPLVIQLCEFMTESVQGSCFMNQVDLSSNQSSMLYDRIFKVTAFSQDPEFDNQQINVGATDEMVTIRTAKCWIRSAMTTTVMSILEDNYDDTLGSRLLSNIDANACMNVIGSIFDGFPEADGKVEGPSVLEMYETCPDLTESDVTEDDIIDHGFQTYCLLNYLLDRENPSKPGQVFMAVKALKTRKNAMAECKKWTTSIEISRHHWLASPSSDPTTIMRVHFKIPDFCLQVQTRDVFKEHCETMMKAILTLTLTLTLI